MSEARTQIVSLGLLIVGVAAASGDGQPFTVSWRSMDAGGAVSIGDGYSLRSVIGQPDGRAMTGGGFDLAGGFLAVELAALCYADFNGDGMLNILDYVAFQNAFVAGDAGADCDGSGGLNILDFVCFQNAFTGGCS